MSNVERLLGAAGEPSPPVSHGEARGGVAAAEWLRHLERAQWAGLGEGLDRNSPTSAAEARDADRAKRDQRRDDPPGAANPAGVVVRAVAKGPPVVPFPAGALESIEGAASPRGATKASGAGAHPAPEVSSPASMRREEATTAAGGDVAAPSTARAAAAVGLGTGPHAAASAAEGNAVLSVEGDALAQPALPQSATELQAAATGGAAEGEGPANSPRPEPAAPRSIRVFADGDGARIVVRDAALDAPAAQALVARIAAELAMGGTRLTEVTVNGAKVFEAPAQGAAADVIRAPAPAAGNEQER